MIYYVNKGELGAARKIKIFTDDEDARLAIEFKIINDEWHGPFEVPTKSELQALIERLEGWMPGCKLSSSAIDAVDKLRTARALFSALAQMEAHNDTQRST